MPVFPARDNGNTCFLPPGNLLLLFIDLPKQPLIYNNVLKIVLSETYLSMKSFEEIWWQVFKLAINLTGGKRRLHSCSV